MTKREITGNISDEIIISGKFEKDYYEACNFEKISVPNVKIIDVEYYNCVFDGAQFVKSLFKSCRFEKCTFKNSDLSLITVSETSFLDTKFVNCKLIGVDWTKSAKPFNVDFENSKMNDSVFFNMDLRSTKMTECEIQNSDFERANLSKAVMTKSDLLNTSFSDTNLSFADLREAVNYRINPVNNNIRRAKFSLPEAAALLEQWEIEIE